MPGSFPEAQSGVEAVRPLRGWWVGRHCCARTPWKSCRGIGCGSCAEGPPTVGHTTLGLRSPQRPTRRMRSAVAPQHTHSTKPRPAWTPNAIFDRDAGPPRNLHPAGPILGTTPVTDLRPLPSAPPDGPPPAARRAPPGARRSSTRQGDGSASCPRRPRRYR